MLVHFKSENFGELNSMIILHVYINDAIINHVIEVFVFILVIEFSHEISYLIKFSLHGSHPFKNTIVHLSVIFLDDILRKHRCQPCYFSV